MTILRIPQAGDILWLPKFDEIGDVNHPGLLSMNPGCFNHPIVLLLVNSLDATATACLLTSLGGQSIEGYCRNQRKHVRPELYPVSPASPHPDSGMLLELQNGLSLTKKSYVKTESLYNLPLSAIREVPGRRILQLTRDSLQSLLHFIWSKSVPQQQVSAFEYAPTFSPYAHQGISPPASPVSDTSSAWPSPSLQPWSLEPLDFSHCEPAYGPWDDVLSGYCQPSPHNYPFQSPQNAWTFPPAATTTTPWTYGPFPQVPLDYVY